MSNATYTTAGTSAALIVTLTNGDRIQMEIPQNTGRGWLKNGLLEAGKGIRGYRAYIARAVLIADEVYNYNANEAREILGLED